MLVSNTWGITDGRKRKKFTEVFERYIHIVFDVEVFYQAKHIENVIFANGLLVFANHVELLTKVINI